MARRILRYEGHGRSRHAVWSDNDPASGNGRGKDNPVARLGVLSATGLVAIGGRVAGEGSAPVERRQVTQAELAARRERDQAASTSEPRRQRPTLTRPAPIPQQEPPMSATIAAPEPTFRRTALEKLSIATTEAVDASEQLEAARIRWEAAERALKEAWAALDGQELPDSHPPTPDPQNGAQKPAPPSRVQTPEEMAQSRRNGTAAMLAGRKPKSVPGALTRRQQEILDAVVAAGGDRRAASAQLRSQVATIEATLEYIGKKGLLPIELIAKLPARFAKYSTVPA